MCCFSLPVQSVSDTNIFARTTHLGRQFLVYSMTLSARDDLAMILPLPVPRGSKENAVRFLNLRHYPTFFEDLSAGFPAPQPVGAFAGGGGIAGGAAPLKVADVGSFEASFVPTIQDFSRLDERFRLPGNVWDQLPRYKDYGFAVFKLKKGEKRIHPMAFDFPRADPKRLFFPTVHIHDGKVHAKADFDHALFCQPDYNRPITNWQESPRPASMFMRTDRTLGIVEPRQHCYLKRLVGKLKNEDIYVY